MNVIELENVGNGFNSHRDIQKGQGKKHVHFVIEETVENEDSYQLSSDSLPEQKKKKLRLREIERKFRKQLESEEEIATQFI